MKKVLGIIALFLVAGCAEGNAEAPSTTTNENLALKEISKRDEQGKANLSLYDSEKARKKEESQKTPEINQAENLIRQYLELDDSSDTVVEYDHTKNGGMVIHVYDVIDKGKKTEHTATRGWYFVTLNPEHIEVIE